jgi:hypothetical protein
VSKERLVMFEATKEDHPNGREDGSACGEMPRTEPGKKEFRPGMMGAWEGYDVDILVALDS